MEMEVMKNNYIEKTPTVNTNNITAEKKQKLSALFEAIKHPAFLVFFFALTLVSLFLNDFKYVFCPPSLDDNFDIVFIVFSVVFLVEFILYCFAMENYFLGFYFFVDIISILSMILENHHILKEISYSLVIYNDTNTNDESYFKNLEKSRDLPDRISKVLSIIRIVRLVRIVKIYKYYRIFEFILDYEKKVKFLNRKIKERNEKIMKNKKSFTGKFMCFII